MLNLYGVILTCGLVALTMQQEHYIQPQQQMNNYWQNPINIRQHKVSKFRAYENITDLYAVIAKEYERVNQQTIDRVIEETEHLDITQLDTKLSNSSLHTMVKKYFYFKSKYYFEINKWYYDVVFNMRKHFKDKHKYSNTTVNSLADIHKILNYERDTDLLFNNLAFKYRSKISTQMKSLRIKFYYFLNTLFGGEHCGGNQFRDVILFAMAV